MKYNFDEIINRIGTASEKWESGGHGGVYFDKNSLSFSIADMDFALAPCIDRAIRDRLDQKVLGYTDVNTDDYRDAVTGWFDRRFGWKIDGRLIYAVDGVMPGVRKAISAHTEPGDGVIIQQPVYPPFMSSVESLGRKIVVNKLIKGDDNFYTMDFDALEAQLADKNNKVMLLCSPHNPVGRVWTKEELETVADLCHKHGVVLVSDEIHCDLTRTGVVNIPVAKLRPEYDIITCVSPSKTFNIAGLQVANMVFTNMALRKKTAGPGGVQMANPLSKAALIGAYNGGDDWLDEARKYIDGNLVFLKEWLEANLPKVKYLVPQGTYLTWLDISAYQPDSEKFAKDCGRGGIIVEQGDVFGEGGKGFIRFNVGTPKANIAEGLARMKKVIEVY